MRGRTLFTPSRPLSAPGGTSQRALRPLSPPAPALLTQAVVASARSDSGLSVPLVRGPYQNNGATPWFAHISMGTPAQSLKMALDTGSNFIWATSSLCGPDTCQHYGGGQFDYGKSSTFRWVDREEQVVDFGPWGSMTIERGQDYFNQPDDRAIPATFFLAKKYSGSQFDQLDWDGGIGMPSGSDYADPRVSFLMAEWMNAGLVDPTLPFLSFSTDPSTSTGSVRIGGVDSSAFDPCSGIFMRWSPYTAFAGVQYLWSTSLFRYSVGTQVVASNIMFCLDSGSSQFKGDTTLMNTTLALVQGSSKPDVFLSLGQTADGAQGEITVPPSVYEVKIEAGPQKGETLPQFQGLGLTDLVLVGSVLMDLLYTIYEYQVTQTPSGGYHLSPVGMWIFNKKGGPELIRSRSQAPALVGKAKTIQRI